MTSLPPSPAQISWDLTLLYPTEEGWEQDKQRFADSPEFLASFSGKLGNSSTELAEALEQISELTRDFARFSSYASLKRAEDARDPVNVERSQVVSMIGTNMWSALSYMEPELLAVGEEQLITYLNEEPRLEIFRFYITNLLRDKPHTLGAEAEQVISLLSPLGHSSQSVFGILTNSDIVWPTITLSTGEEVQLTQSNYGRYRASDSREDRIQVFQSYWRTVSAYESTLGNTYFHNVRGGVLSSRTRKYETALAQRFSRDNLPEAVYETLIDQVHSGLPSLHHYLKLRRDWLGLEQLHYHDINNPLAPEPRTYSFAEAKELVLQAAAPLGEDYTRRLQSGLEGSYMHVYPQPGKTPGAFMSGGVVDAHPYVLLNYTGDFDNVSTLAHEWGHALHSVYSNETQPYTVARYSTFIAEIAAFTNELLLNDHMLKSASTPSERIYFLNQGIDRIRGAFFRQAKFAEFELLAHTAVEQGRPLSGQRLSSMYGSLLQTYLGHEEGIVVIDPEYHIEWAIVPHFYNNFYVYNYATSIAAASYFAKAILEGDQEVLSAYHQLLRAGGSDHPHELLRSAGLDMTTPVAYKALIDLFDFYIAELEAIGPIEAK